MSYQKNEAYFRALAEAEAAKDLRRAHAKRVLAHQEAAAARLASTLQRHDEQWLGWHSWAEPNHAGWDSFVVYAKRIPHTGIRQFYWSAADDDGSPVGCETGPFATAKEAYYDAA